LNYAYRQDLNWLVSDFTMRVPDVAHAAVVSADGVPLSLSDEIPGYFAEQLAAITSGLASLMQGAARIFEAGLSTQALVEMEGGLMIVKAISDGSSLCVLASPDCDTELVSYEMSLLVEAAGEVLSPALRGSAARGGTTPLHPPITGGLRPPVSPPRGATAQPAVPPARW
jgi:predicted regulator of Ras-like GTPase activity (Roadblock/LC7/MglB family)